MEVKIRDTLTECRIGVIIDGRFIKASIVSVHIRRPQVGSPGFTFEEIQLFARSSLNFDPISNFISTKNIHHHYFAKVFDYISYPRERSSKVSMTGGKIWQETLLASLVNV